MEIKLNNSIEKQRATIKRDTMTKAVHGFAYVFIVLFALACLIPFVLMISASFSTETVIAKTGFGILPKGFTVAAYDLIFKSPRVLIGSYCVTIIMTVLRNFFGVIYCSHDRVCAST